MEFQQEEYLISTDPQKMDLAAIHLYLSQESYWAKNIPYETVEKAIKNSMPFGIFHQEKQVGFARIISDYATFAYLADVFLLPEHRGKGLSKWLMEVISKHPELQGLRRFILATADAHTLYSQFGWEKLSKPERWMEIYNPNVYSDQISESQK